VTFLLEARGVSASMPADSGIVRVLDGISLALSAGELVDVIGPSGSGKTTFLRSLARLLPGSAGEFFLDGVPAEQIAPGAWRAQVALLPQKPAIAEGDVRANLLLPWTLRIRRGRMRPTDEALLAALGHVGLADIALDRDASRLSVGQAARVALMRVLLTEPRVLLLDEPDAALDEGSSDAVTELTREFAESGGAVVRVRHHRTDGLASRRLRLEGGHLCADTGVAS
jgi:putative ABC transport system ATP-binding protein